MTLARSAAPILRSPATVLPAAPRAGTLAAAILVALEDDTMTAAEIARQLAKRDARPTPAELTVCLRRMWADGLLAERTILGAQCFQARGSSDA
jgi:hypothetical protein